jgi:hypothetical protein
VDSGWVVKYLAIVWGQLFGVRESAGINRLGIENERVLRRTTSH